MFSPAGEEFCIEENIAKDSSCKVGDSGGRMEIKVWISKVYFSFAYYDSFRLKKIRVF